MSEPVDVCLLAEGNFPFVVGGVSEWIRMLVEKMPEIRFSVVAIVKYQLGPNMTAIHEVSIAEESFKDLPGRSAGARAWETVKDFHRGLARGDLEPFGRLVRLIRGVDGEVLNPREIFESDESWQVFMGLAAEMERFSPLIDTFFTWRSTHMPLMHVLQARLPRARVYHAVSTGYAGVLGAVGKVLYGSPLILTEHGIYTKEREMEIMRAAWIDDSQRQFWLRYFNGLARIAYHFSDAIVALFETNRQIQIGAGAPEGKTRVIPNGVDLSKYMTLTRAPADGVLRVGTVARVTPIKDVKTFIRACALVAREREDVEFHVLGPGDESPEYMEECLFLARDLGVDRRLHFQGRVDVKLWYPKLDVVVLSSVKEAQPLSLIEALSVGCACVATRVGSVPEILKGVGELVQPKRPTAMAEAILRLLGDDRRRERRARDGAEKVRQIYDLDQVIASYRRLYAGDLAPG
jgi:glycosyltransferase involved in cell wall biosynthesis